MASNSKENEAVVVAFDAYGTLLFTESIAKKLASHFGDEKAKTIATTWRKYQLDSTWRLNSMGRSTSAPRVLLSNHPYRPI